MLTDSPNAIERLLHWTRRQFDLFAAFVYYHRAGLLLAFEQFVLALLGAATGVAILYGIARYYLG